MKLKLVQVEPFLQRPDSTIRAILVYGSDSGQVCEILDTLTTAIVVNRQDPFRVSELTAATVRADPARLADEAATLALTGGRRVVRVRDADDTLASVLSSFLTTSEGEALIVVAAGELGKASRLRRLFEETGNTVALPCYLDEAKTLELLIHDTLRQFGLKGEAAAMTYLVEHLGSDRLQSRRELEKLVLYTQSGGDTVTLADAMSCVGDDTDLTLDGLAMAIADGNQGRADRMYRRLILKGVVPVGILRVLIRHFQRLYLAAGLVACGRNVEQAMAALKPPLFFKIKDRFRTQLLVWPEDRLLRALEMLMQAEIDCKTIGLPDQTMCGQTLLQLTRIGASLQQADGGIKVRASNCSQQSWKF